MISSQIGRNTARRPKLTKSEIECSTSISTGEQTRPWMTLFPILIDESGQYALERSMAGRTGVPLGRGGNERHPDDHGDVSDLRDDVNRTTTESEGQWLSDQASPAEEEEHGTSSRAVQGKGQCGKNRRVRRRTHFKSATEIPVFSDTGVRTE